MTALYIIDNPTGLPLEADPPWMSRLGEALEVGDRVLLMGFDDDALIAIRRRLAACCDETDLLAISQHTQQALAAHGQALLAEAIRGLVAGLDIDRHHYWLHGAQPSRQAYVEGLLAADGSTVSPSRPRLAFVSPLPPEATGIADYSAELLPYLALHYDITLVASQPVVEAPLAQRFPVLEPSAFRAAFATFDRVLYQVGNSPYHVFQFELLRDCPGTVVLHDIYLFDAAWWLDDSGLWPDGLRRQLFQDHGYPAVLALDAHSGSGDKCGRGPEEYPVNGFVTQESAGLILHSHFAKSLDRHWRYEAWKEPAAVIPHLRKLPEPATAAWKEQCRRELGIEEDACLIASFGGINPKKLTDRVVDAILEGQWAEQAPVHLVLVGAAHREFRPAPGESPASPSPRRPHSRDRLR